MRLGRSLGTLAACALLAAFATPTHAYYHFIRYSTRTAPWRALPEKFDLNALPAKTLSYFIRDYSHVQLAAGDSDQSLVSQIRAAAQTWNSVESSDMRLGFGGVTNANVAHSSPHLEVLFEEVPPGVVAQGGIEIRAESNGTFVPIVRSIVRLPSDMTGRPSYTESFGTTLIHEFGHALGLQHTLTSSVMSTATTRSTSKARPLSADDVAAISLLYPAPNFLAVTGSISGRVTFTNGDGVNLASVVAISPSGGAISTLTHPDGTYKIEGLPPRNYYVYVHPLPPPIQAQTTNGGVEYPTDSEGRSLPPSDPFETVFHRGSLPATRDFTQAFTSMIAAGTQIENVNFSVRPTASVRIHSVETYAYPGNFAVKPPYLSPSIAYPFVIATGAGLTQGNAPASSLRVSVLGGTGLAVKRFDPAPAHYIQADFDVRNLAFSSDSAKHLVFTSGNDTYVLPSAFYHVNRQPPFLASATPATEDGVRVARISGSHFSPETRILFDGVPAQILPNGTDTTLTVIPPPASAGHRAVVLALNPDGQSSLFLQNTNPPAYIYPSDGATTMAALTPTASVATLPVGTESLVEINIEGANLTPETTAIGFGTPDVVALRFWVAGPSKLMANIWVSPQAQLGPVQMTLTSGLKTVVYPLVFTLIPASARSFYLNSRQSNVATGGSSIWPAALATISVGASPVTLTTSNASIIFGDRRVPIEAVDGNNLTFAVPATAVEGLTVVRIEVGGERSFPIGLQVDAAPVVRAATPDQPE